VTSPETAMFVALVLPLLAAAGSLLLRAMPNVRDAFSVAVGCALLWTVAGLVPTVMHGGRPGLVLFEIFEGLPFAFELEPLGMLFLLVVSTLWIITTCYAIGYMRGHHEQNQPRFFACFGLAIFASVGAAMAGNMLTLFFFYELLTLSTYPLVTHHQTEAAKRGGRIYLGILMGTSVVLLLLGVVWTWVIAGTLDFKDGGILAGKASDGMIVVLLALYAFGTGKAALMPFHRWLPAAMVAPTPVSALLHAVAVVKVGVFTVVKVVVYIFGIDLLAETGASHWLMWAAATTILLASLVAMTKDNLKERLAYSTVSQLGYIVLGAALASHWGIIGSGMHIAMHAVGKITLFFCAGAIYVATHKTEISQMRGIGRSMPFTMTAYTMGAISVIGLPPFGGAWSKWYLALGAADAGQVLLVAVLMISSLLNIACLMPISMRAFFCAPSEGPERPPIKEAPAFCVVPLCVTAVGSLALFFFAGDIYALLVLLTPLAGK